MTVTETMETVRPVTGTDAVTALLPPLVTVPDMTATRLAQLARDVRAEVEGLAWEDEDDIEALVGLRRQLHSMASIVSRRAGLADATIELDTACRIVDRAAILAVCRAQGDGKLPPGDRTRAAWLGSAAPGLCRLHVETGLSAEQFAVILRQCRQGGSVTHSAVARAASGLPVLAPAPEPEPAPGPQRSADEVAEHVRAVIRLAGDAAESAAKVTDRDVTALDPPLAADLARELWDWLVVSTGLYADLARHANVRATRTGQ